MDAAAAAAAAAVVAMREAAFWIVQRAMVRESRERELDEV
jgi:hypothetical protein